MPVIDVQVHPFDRNRPGRPWAGPSHGLDSATGEEMVAAMQSAGVDGAILVSSQGIAPFRDTKRLSEDDKAALMGGTLLRVYNC